jgi:hypothetical protein
MLDELSGAIILSKMELCMVITKYETSLGDEWKTTLMFSDL